MSNNIHLKKGLSIPVSGCAEASVSMAVSPEVVAIQPADFKGLIPRLLVREGDKVLSGSPIMADKKCPDIIISSPVSGTVKEVVRGEKRKLLAVLVEADPVTEYVDFGIRKIEDLTSEDIRKAILGSGLWPAIIQRPYGFMADPSTKPAAIFVSAFNSAPLAADTDFTLSGEIKSIQAGVDVLSKLCDEGVHVSVDGSKPNSVFCKIKNATIHSFTGKHPAGNVGVQIANIRPIHKGDIVWTVPLHLVAAIGKLFTEGRYNVRRKISVAGPGALEPSYIETIPGMPMKCLAGFYGNTPENVRIVSGDILTGINTGQDGYLGFFHDQATIIREGYDKELFGWARPFRIHQYSSDHTYFKWCLGWLTPGRKYDMTTNLHGGPRAFVMSDSYYAKVLPMDIFPLYLIKACLAGDIDKMEQFGIYEVLPEDFALCEYIDPSKNNIQDIIQKGIDLMVKEMA